jgi:hypothetical protein
MRSDRTSSELDVHSSRAGEENKMIRSIGSAVGYLAIWGVAGAIVMGCDNDHPRTEVDASVPVDAGPDAAQVDAAPVPTQITIRTFAPGVGHIGPTANATLVAFQDGDGPWAALTGAGGIYLAISKMGRYAVAIGCGGDLPSVAIHYASVMDSTELNADGCFAPPTVKVSVTLSGLADGETGEVWFGADVAGARQPVDAFDVDVPMGMVDVFVRARQSGVATKVFRGPRLDVRADQALSLDLGTMGVAPQARALSLSNRDPLETVSVHTSHATPLSQVQWPVVTNTFGAGDSGTYFTLPDSVLKPDDVSNVTVTAARTTSDERDIERIVRAAMKSPGALTLALPDIAYEPTAPTVDKAAVPRATVTIPIVADAQNTVSYTVSLMTNEPQPPGGTGLPHTLTLQVRSGWAGTQSSVMIVTPDLSSLPGWAAGMALVSGAAMRWVIMRNSSNLGYEPAPVDGRRITHLTATGTVTP